MNGPCRHLPMKPGFHLKHHAEFPAEELADFLRRELHKVRGVDAAYMEISQNLGRVYVAALEHESVDKLLLFEVEELARDELGLDVDIHVRAHQGRDPDKMFYGLERLF